jgi:PAS domain S-box-containing protein
MRGYPESPLSRQSAATGSRLLRSARLTVAACCSITSLLAVSDLVGWAFHLHWLKGLGLGSATMKPNTAAGLLLAALAVWLTANGRLGWIVRAVGIVLVAVTLLTLAEYLWHVDLHIDQVFFKDTPGVASSAPERMSLAGAFCLMGLGVALLLAQIGRPRASQAFAIAVIAGTAVAVLGYGYGVQALSFSPFNDMAVNTAISLLALGLGVLFAQPAIGVMALLGNQGGGGVAVRRLLPVAVILPIAAGLLGRAGWRLGLYDVNFAMGVTVALIMVISSLLVVQIARAVGRADTHSRQSEARLESVLQAAAEAILAVDQAGSIVLANPRAEQMFGYGKGELIGHPIEALLPDRLRDVHAAHLGGFMVNPHSRTMGAALELWARRRDGSEFPVEISLGPVAGDEPLVSAIVTDITTRRRAQEAVRELTRDLEHRVEERTAELQTAKDEMESFSYSVAHDLRAPVRAIAGFARILLEEESPNAGQTSHYLERMRENAQRMGTLIDDLLALSRLGRQEVNAQEVATRELVQRVVADVGGDGAVEFVVGDLPPCQADPGLLKIVLVNLISNAVKFSRGQAAPRVEIGFGSNGGGPAYYVRDNGAGFDMAYAGKLFGVFQRLHSDEEFEGTGIGLATVHRIVQRHGGRVWAEGAVDEGATFYFTLSEGDRDG